MEAHTVKHRYLVYDIDKHQASPHFTDVLQPWMYELESMSVVVDLVEGKRLWNGEWEEVPTYGIGTTEPQG